MKARAKTRAPERPVNAVLALDLGSTMGWAKWRRGVKDIHTSGSVELDEVGNDRAIRFLALQRWLSDNARDVDLIVYEMPHHRGGAATGVLVGLEAHLMSWCLSHDLRPPEKIHSATIKKTVAGYGRADKKDVAAAVRVLVPVAPDADDNETDAVAVLLTGLEKFASPS